MPNQGLVFSFDNQFKDIFIEYKAEARPKDYVPIIDAIKREAHASISQKLKKGKPIRRKLISRKF